MLPQRLLGEGLKLLVRHLGARRANDSGRFGKLVVALPVVERRQELAFCEISGSAKDYEVKWVHGDDLARHACPRQSGSDDRKCLI